MKIQVEFLREPGRSPEWHEFSRVPCVGEYLVFGDESFRVHSVFHLDNPDFDQNLRGMVRVE